MSNKDGLEAVVNQIIDDAALAVRPPLLPLEARMREKARGIAATFELDWKWLGRGDAARESLIQEITKFGLTVAREMADIQAKAILDVTQELAGIQDWNEWIKLKKELAQARAELDRLHTGIGLFVDGRTEFEGLEDDYKESLEIGDRIITELEQARADLERAQEATTKREREVLLRAIAVCDDAGHPELGNKILNFTPTRETVQALAKKE